MVTRINGMSSGMDIDTLVKQLMQAKRAPLDKLLKKQQTLQWQQDDYRTMNSKILDLKNTAFNAKLQSSYLSKKVTSAYDDIISASGTPAATDGIYRLEVKRLAESASVTSSAYASTVSLASKMEDIYSSVGTNTVLTIGGEKGTASIEVHKTDTLATFISNFNNKSTFTGVKVSYDDTMKRLFFVSTNTGDDAKVELNASDSSFLTNVLKLTPTATGKTGETVTGAVFQTTPPDAPDLDKLIDSTLASAETFRINFMGKDYNFAISNTTKIGNLIDQINASGLASAGVKAGLEKGTGKLTFTLPTNGEAITFSDQTAGATNILSKLGLPSTPSTGTVQGAAFVTPVPPYTDVNKVIDSSITEPQKFRLSYGAGPNDFMEFNVNNKTTIGSLINAINTSDLGKKGVSARLDQATGNLIITSLDNSQQLKFEDLTSGYDLLGKLGLPNGVATGTSFTYDQVQDKGLSAQIVYNGVDATYASNTFTINGVNFTAKKVAIGTNVNVTVSQDVDTVYNNIKTFIDKYNETIDSINKKLSEERFRKFEPLTSEQKTAMKDKEIELWEEKAKSGLLKNDSILSNTMNSFRTSFYESVSGLSSSDYQQLGDIGITTLDYTEKGKLYISESKLKEAIAANPEQVMRLFTANDGDDKSTSGDGVAYRIYEAADRALSQLKDKAGTSTTVMSQYEIGKQLTSINKDIDRWQDRLADLEDQYYRRFTAMEQAMNKYNAQSSYLAQFAAK